MFDVTHFTAWVVNDTSCLPNDRIDVTVLEDTLAGDDPSNDDHWQSGGPQVFYAETTVDARDGAMEDALAQAVNLMAKEGWEVVGKWRVSSSAYLATVAKES